MAKDQDDEKLSDDTLDNLEQVKKGKPRKFIMICKGTSVISLVVYKKGSVDKFKKEAKEAGKGQIYAGVVDGRGVDIHFKLSKAEYGDKQPVKPLVLKSFLEEKADIKCKPAIDMVDMVGLVLDEDDPEVKRFVALQEAALAACDARPDLAGEINPLCLAIGKHFDEGQRDEAIAKLDKLVALLNMINAPKGSVPPPPPTAGPKTADQELEAILKRVRPEVEVMVKGGVDTSSRASALSAIDQLKTDAKIPAAVDAAKELLSNLGDDYRDRLDKISPRVAKLLSGSFTERAGDVEKIKTVFAFAQERGDTERYGSALVALKNVETLLKAAETEGAPKEADVIQKGTVAARAKFVTSRWQTTVRQVRVEIDKLHDAIALENPDEEDAAEIPKMIQAAIDEFCDEINDAILGVQKATDEDAGAVENALKVIRSYRERVASDPLIQHLNEADADLGVAVNVEKTLLDALDEIESQLAA